MTRKSRTARHPRGHLLGLQGDRRVVAIKPRPALRVVRPQEGGEASHPGRRTEGCTPAARRCREAPKLNPSLLDSIPTIAYSPKGPAQPRGVVARRSDDG